MKQILQVSDSFYLYRISMVFSDHILTEPSSEAVTMMEGLMGWTTILVTAREWPRKVWTSPPRKLHIFTENSQSEKLLHVWIK